MEKVLGLFKLGATNCQNTGVLPSLYDGLICDPANMTPIISSVHDVIVIIANVVRIMIALSGGVAVIIIIVGSIYYITSLGDPGRIKQAKDIITNTVVGLVVILSAYAVLTFISGWYS